MTKNPYLNAVFAAVYIVAIVLVLSTFVDVPDGKGNVVVPMAMLSLLVLSACVM